MTEDFQARVVAQLKLALLGDCGCRQTLANLEDEARSSGLTGAEIDAALDGRSFEVRTAAALAFACAIKAGEDGAIEQARDHAIHFGVTDEELIAVAEEAKRISCFDGAVIRFLASLFRLQRQQRQGNDALGEYLRNSSCTELTPETLLRIV